MAASLICEPLCFILCPFSSAAAFLGAVQPLRFRIAFTVELFPVGRFALALSFSYPYNLGKSTFLGFA